ncbi:nitroreductase/quinone reductase family protein [Actinocorallia longicatena]|uniref:Deazaflavin-dependent oxidoreductase (Nitroreductase family) n=1 Tax=Actinocorallia longicatena TaxID=111803 RepID=A0ABP6QN14_9ACTN
MGVIERLAAAPHWKAADPPRVPFGGRADLGVPAWLVSKGVGLLAGTGETRLVQVLGLLPEVARAYLPFAYELVPRGSLGRAPTELVTLRATWNAGGWYEFFHHVHLSRNAGISIGNVERIAEGKGGDERQRALIAATDDLYRERELGAAARARLEGFLSAGQIRDLCFLVGHYEMLAMLLKSAGAEPEPGAWESGPLGWLRSADDSDRFLPDWPGWFSRAANAVQGRYSPYLPPFATVVHRGRISGTVRRTPVTAVRNGNKIIIFVMYGDRSDWVRNVLAADGGGIERLGRLHRIRGVRLTDAATDGDLVPAPFRPVARLSRLLVADLDGVPERPSPPRREAGAGRPLLPAWHRFREAVRAEVPPGLYAAAEAELLTDRMLSDRTWAELALTVPQKLALCLSVGVDATEAMVRNSGFRVEDR